MFSGVCVAIALGAFIPALRDLYVSTNEVIGVVLACAVILGVGLVDDLRTMSAPAKVAGEVLAACVLYFAGVTMWELKIPFHGALVLGPGILPLITALWVIAITNAINLIDGLDGLAAGIVALGGTLCVYGLRLEHLGLLPTTNIGPLVAAATCGACLGFLPLQLPPRAPVHGRRRRAPARRADERLDDGDRRAHPSASGVTYFFFAPLFMPFLILGVPIIDMTFAIIRRTASGAGVPQRGQGPHPPPPAAPRPRPPAHRRDPVAGGRPCSLRWCSSPSTSRASTVFIPIGVAAHGRRGSTPGSTPGCAGTPSTIPRPCRCA